MREESWGLKSQLNHRYKPQFIYVLIFRKVLLGYSFCSSFLKRMFCNHSGYFPRRKKHGGIRRMPQIWKSSWILTTEELSSLSSERKYTPTPKLSKRNFSKLQEDIQGLGGSSPAEHTHYHVQGLWFKSPPLPWWRWGGAS